MSFIMNERMIKEQKYVDNMSEEEKNREKEWSYDECRRKGCLPTGEPLDYLFGA